MARSNLLGNCAHIHIHCYLYRFSSGNGGQSYGKMVARRQPYFRHPVCAFVGPPNLAVFSGWWIAVGEL